MYQKRVEEALQAIRKGEIIIVMDDEDRENEGDLVMAGIFSTPEKINFMAKEARGLICVSLSKELAQKFDLNPMVEQNSSNHETAFTISIDAASAKTGISAHERDLTIQLLCSNHASAADFVRPGHIFPLIAKDGGVLVRTGHTEASVDLCNLAGLKSVSVICEIMKDDGSMARDADLKEFAKTHNLKILYVSDLVQYRLQFEKLVRLKEQGKAKFLGAECVKYTFCDHEQNKHIVFAFGDTSANPIVKFQKIKKDYEYFESLGLDGAKDFLKSVKKLQESGGYLVFLESMQQQDLKAFGIGAQILRELGIEKFNLFSSSAKISEFSALSGFGLDITNK